MAEVSEKEFQYILPTEIWSKVISFLPRVSRLELAQIQGFDDLVEQKNNIEDSQLNKALETGKCFWTTVPSPLNKENTMRPRLMHGSINIENRLIIFGGAAGQGVGSGFYNDVWFYDSVSGYERMITNGQYPTPRANFGIARSKHEMIIVGGRLRLSFPEPLMFQTNYNCDVYMLNITKSSWQRVITSGDEPSALHMLRCSMISEDEMLTFGGAAIDAGNASPIQPNMELSVLKFTSKTKCQGHWHQITNWNGTRPVSPRIGHHQVLIGEDLVLIYGGTTGINGSLNDAWVIKLLRHSSGQQYSVRAIKLTVHDPISASFHSWLYPSCLLDKKLIFCGTKTPNPSNSKMQDPPRPERRRSPSKSPEPPPNPRKLGIRHRTPVMVNERPLNTIGTMSAFAVAPEVHHQPITSRHLPRFPLEKKPNNSPKEDPEPPDAGKRQRRDNPMRIFILDLRNIMKSTEEEIRRNPSIRWIRMRECEDGLFPGAPDQVAYATLTELDNKLVLVGGVQRNHQEEDPTSFLSNATNVIHFLNYEKYEKK